ncbi:MAG: hypothetical protein ABEH83_05870 [Halobacterium sp.]
MVDVSTIAAADFALGTIAAVGLFYLLYTETTVVHYPRLFELITAGLLLYAATGPVVGRLAPAYIHLVHGVAAVCIAAGLWSLVADDAGRDTDFETIITTGDDAAFGDESRVDDD